MKSLKWFLWGLNVCLLCVAIFLGYKIYNQKMLAETNARISKTISQELTEMEKHQDYALQSGMIDQTFVSVAYPTDASKKVIKAVETEMKSYVEKSFGKSEKVGEVRHLAFLNATSSDLGLDKVKKYSLQVRRYENTKKTIKKVEENHIKDILVDNEGNVFSLAQLVSDEGFLKEKLLGKLEVALNESNQLNDSTKSQVENLRQNDFKNLSFNLTEGQLTINLPEKIADQESISLPLSDLYEKIDSNYLMGSDLESYNAYQEEKVRAEERAKSLMSGHPQVSLEGKVVALTFDDGPNPASTPRILDTLKQHNAKATFFVIGSSVVGNEGILKREDAEGHEIGNHTWSHPSLPSLSVNDIKWQMDETTKVITASTGKPVKFMRPPYGASNATVQATVGLPQIFWDVDTLDWKNRNTQSILANVQSQLRPGAVILMHDIHGTTADALPTVLDYLTSQGYQCVTLSELYGI